MANPQDVAGSSSTPREVERHLIVEQIPKENLFLASIFDLSGTLSEYKGDWRLVSHAFDIREDGSALLTCILERTI